MGMTRSHGVLLLAAAAEGLVPPIRSSLIRPRSTATLRAIPMDAIELTTQTLAANAALTSTADELAGSLFGASLLPWLAMLYWLKHPKTQAPKGVCFGLTYLLAFVFGSIPAAISAGALYGASLADADWLHGAAPARSALSATSTASSTSPTARAWPRSRAPRRARRLRSGRRTRSRRS